MTAPVNGESAGSLALSEADAAMRQEDVTTIDTLLLDCRDADLWRQLRRMRAHLLAELSAGHELAQVPSTSWRYDFDILPLTDAVDGGWTLRLLQNGKEVGGAVFPLVVDEEAGVAWWKFLNDIERAQWMRRAPMPTEAGAYVTYLSDAVWQAASEAAGAWIDAKAAIERVAQVTAFHLNKK